MESRECVWYRVCPMKRAYERGLLEERFIREYCLGDFELCVRYRMESRGKPHPDWMRQDGVLDERLKGR
ncbi:MAG: uracil-DNA glycosylase [Spirochaetia bacterium]